MDLSVYDEDSICCPMGCPGEVAWNAMEDAVSRGERVDRFNVNRHVSAFLKDNRTICAANITPGTVEEEALRIIDFMGGVFRSGQVIQDEQAA